MTSNNNSSLSAAAPKSNYHTIKELGRGAFATVLLAEHVDTKEKVAVKRIPNPDVRNSGMVADPEQELERRRQLRREELIIREVNIWWELPPHTGVVRLKDAFRSANNTYLVMELMGGGSLEDLNQSARLKKKRVQESRMQQWFAQIVDAIAFLHSHGIVHRDIKPANILLNEDWTVAKIADFGLAREHPDHGGCPTKKVGSFAYMAAEAWRGKHNGFKADIWALGVTIYESLVGTLPFNGSGQLLLNSIQACQFEMPPQVSPEAADLIHRLLNKDPDARPPAMEVVRHAWFTGGTITRPVVAIPTPQRSSPPQDSVASPLAPAVVEIVTVSPSNNQTQKADALASSKRPEFLNDQEVEEEANSAPPEDIFLELPHDVPLVHIRALIANALSAIDCASSSEVKPEGLEQVSIVAEIADVAKICLLRITVEVDRLRIRRLRGLVALYRHASNALADHIKAQFSNIVA